MSKKNKLRFKKSYKGKLFRPCHVCGETVNFILWTDETEIRGRKIYHWANEDGSHHVHGIKELSDEQKHLNSILQRE